MITHRYCTTGWTDEAKRRHEARIPGLRDGTNDDDIEITWFTPPPERWEQPGLKLGRWWIPLRKWRRV